LSKKWNKKNNFYSSVFKPSILKSSELLPEELLYTSRLVKTRTKKYFLCIPIPLELKSDNQAAEKSMIFLDPGVNNFVTGYDPSGKIIIWGENDIGRLLHYKRKLQSKIKKEKKQSKKYRMNIALLRMGEKIKNLVDEMHKKLSKWLCENYENIYLPRLNFHTCKKLNNKSKAKMASYSHCAFSDRLINKVREYSNCKVTEINEAFTSKTCCCCGYQKRQFIYK
jgi:transposase